MYIEKKSIVMVLCTFLLLGCSIPKDELIKDMLAESEGHYTIYVFFEGMSQLEFEEFEMELLEIVNSDSRLEHFPLERMQIYSLSDVSKSDYVKAFSLQDTTILVFDTEKLVLETSESQQLKEFIENLH